MLLIDPLMDGLKDAARMRAVRVVSHGVSRNPSSVVMASATPETSSVMWTLPNCSAATAAVEPETMTGPK